MKIVTKILAAFMSILLVVLLVVTPVISFAANVISRNTIKEIITNPEIKSKLISSTLPDNAKDSAFFEEFLSSNCFDEMFVEITDYMLAPIYGENKTLTAQDISRIAEKNIDELVAIFKKTAPESEQLSDTELRESLLQSITGSSPDMIKSLDEARKELPLSEFALIIKYIKIAFYIVIGLVVVLTGLICLCTYRRFNAFIWVCADYGVAALLVFTISCCMTFITDFISVAVTNSVAEIFVNFVIDKFDSYLITAAIIYAVIALLCLAAAITFKNVFKKKKAAQKPIVQNESPALAAETETKSSQERFSEAEEFIFVNYNNNN
ncbi:MAG: hypothetical protein E7384_02060 [Ruminococcaceae bacterium]|nr:hypothetical protein [Oscillospiraceae bacterium]